MENAEKYLGLTFTDIYNKTLTLTIDGIEITRSKGIWRKFHRMIPYSAVLDVYTQKASIMTAGFFSLLTSVGGVASTESLFSMKQANDVAENESTFAYRKKSTETVRKIIEGINSLKDHVPCYNRDPLAEYWGMGFKDMYGKKMGLAPDGIHLTKGRFNKIIRYSNILDTYIEFPVKATESGILSVVENTGLTAHKKLEQLKTEKTIKFANDENSLLFIKSSSSEVEKVYYAIQIIHRSSSRYTLKSPCEDPDDFDFASEIDGMDGHDFEYYCADILRKNGFANVQVTKGSGDQGVDILAEKGGVKYAIQCKNYASPLSNTPVQEVSAGKLFYGCHVGAVMTNSTFTPGAKSLAEATGVLLWDRVIVKKMMEIME